MAEKDAKPRRIAAENRKARFEYAIADTLEAGIALQGSEVKSLRAGKATIGESYAAEKNGELFLVNAYIPEYLEAHQFNHETKRPRKLLLHRRQVDKLVGAVQREGMTIVPLKIYFKHGLAKCLLAVGKGKKMHDKRQDIKKRESDREIARELARKK